MAHSSRKTHQQTASNMILIKIHSRRTKFSNNHKISDCQILEDDKRFEQVKYMVITRVAKLLCMILLLWIHDTMCFSKRIELCSAKNESQYTQISTSQLGNQMVPGWNVDCKKRIKCITNAWKKISLRDSEGKMWV